mmetsp:Transcript_3362/g.13558  ORF Transcript_3362/g.13558 Transcript_3362/m.13558 type:complete len:322 (+) Transcript_3362:903-1868(+)
MTFQNDSSRPTLNNSRAREEPFDRRGDVPHALLQDADVLRLVEEAHILHLRQLGRVQLLRGGSGGGGAAAEPAPEATRRRTAHPGQPHSHALHLLHHAQVRAQRLRVAHPAQNLRVLQHLAHARVGLGHRAKRRVRVQHLPNHGRVGHHRAHHRAHRRVREHRLHLRQHLVRGEAETPTAAGRTAERTAERTASRAEHRREGVGVCGAAGTSRVGRPRVPRDSARGSRVRGLSPLRSVRPTHSADRVRREHRRERVVRRVRGRAETDLVASSLRGAHHGLRHVLVHPRHGVESLGVRLDVRERAVGQPHLLAHQFRVTRDF